MRSCRKIKKENISLMIENYKYRWFPILIRFTFFYLRLECWTCHSLFFTWAAWSSFTISALRRHYWRVLRAIMYTSRIDCFMHRCFKFAFSAEAMSITLFQNSRCVAWFVSHEWNSSSIDFVSDISCITWYSIRNCVLTNFQHGSHSGGQISLTFTSITLPWIGGPCINPF